MWLHEEQEHRELIGTMCARRQTRPCHCCRLITGRQRWRRRCSSYGTVKKGQRIVEIFAVDVMMTVKMRKLGTSVSKTESTDEQLEDVTTTTTTNSTPWQPSRAEETVAILELHLQDEYRGRCEQSIPPRHVWLHEPLVSETTASRSDGHHEKTEWNKTSVGAHESGQKREEQLERCLCADHKGHRENPPKLGHPSVQQMEKLFREAKACGESNKAL